MLGGEEAHKFMGRARMESRDFGGLINPGSRQIYLTFPADSTFREEDVSNYFRFVLDDELEKKEIVEEKGI